MDIGAARERLGYEPATSLVDGLRATWAWYLAHRGEHEQKVDYFRESA
jgi:nucleoside-diphosphate-sugar epimerase